MANTPSACGMCSWKLLVLGVHERVGHFWGHWHRNWCARAGWHGARARQGSMSQISPVWSDRPCDRSGGSSAMASADPPLLPCWLKQTHLIPDCLLYFNSISVIKKHLFFHLSIFVFHRFFFQTNKFPFNFSQHLQEKPKTSINPACCSLTSESCIETKTLIIFY